ncbi:Glycosyltransferase [Melia azedarach]|uniref:Glycosyltransferase n=1 Tax=Melia azedarach TaxID=155640 RepID=A0ACC1WR57_MELAZ|nr:Glycosyltransferase [Melia azedarach]
MAAKELNIPNVLFWMASICGFFPYVHYCYMLGKGLFPLKDVSYLINRLLDTAIDWIHSMESIKLKDILSFIRTTDANDMTVNFAISEVENACNAPAFIFNTFDDLEPEILDPLSSIYPPIYAISHLLLLLNNQIPADSAFSYIELNLWKEQLGCVEWFDSKEQNSIVYANFGSITVMKEK